MGYVTKEMSAKARKISALEYVLSNEPNNIKRVGSSYRLRDHDSLSISDKGFFWHSRGFGGTNAIDFLTKVRNYDFVSAVCHLIGEKPLEKGETARTSSNPTIPTKAPSNHQSGQITYSNIPSLSAQPTPLLLPKRNSDNYSAIAYLMNRGIDKAIIKDCINSGILYESSPYHNAVFLGKDENGKTRSAFMRGTIGNFKRDADGSVKEYGFVLSPKNPQSTTVMVFESPIDCLSHLTLCNQGHLQGTDGWRLALGGTSLRAFDYFMSRHPEINHCIICTDHDEAGDLAAKKIVDELSPSNGKRDITAERQMPLLDKKDWNDSLMAVRKLELKKNKLSEMEL